MEITYSRNQKRLLLRRQNELTNLFNDLVEKSKEAPANTHLDLFMYYNDQWRNICKMHNAVRSNYKLEPKAFENYCIKNGVKIRRKNKLWVKIKKIFFVLFGKK